MDIKILNITPLYLFVNDFKNSDSYFFNKENFTCGNCGKKNLFIENNKIFCKSCGQIIDIHQHIGYNDFQKIRKKLKKSKNKFLKHSLITIYFKNIPAKIVFEIFNVKNKIVCDFYFNEKINKKINSIILKLLKNSKENKNNILKEKMLDFKMSLNLKDFIKILKMLNKKIEEDEDFKIFLTKLSNEIIYKNIFYFDLLVDFFKKI